MAMLEVPFMTMRERDYKYKDSISGYLQIYLAFYSAIQIYF